MNGQIGNNYIIKPDQMQLLNPGFIVILIPLFDKIIYREMSKYEVILFTLQYNGCKLYWDNHGIHSDGIR